jgi:dethiobiotin synthetase/adenosylmethionine--8-amino-7-oxononanoate aminotransferase
MVIESAHGDHFNVFSTSSPPLDAPALSSEVAAASPVVPSTSSPSTLSPNPSSSTQTPAPPFVSAPPPSSDPLTSPVFDGSASWWTQCLGHANPELTLAAAHSAGRFGHVMFPSATNLPALKLAEKLISSVGDGWASRAFFSDNGSTGMEVALKMALRAFSDREQLTPEQGRKLAVLGLKGSYHGDTIGAMDACEGSVYSERVEWYEGRGHWLAAPEVKIEKGEVVVRSAGEGGRATKYGSLTELYDVTRRVRDDPLALHYRKEIEQELSRRLAKGDGIQFGALILEPVVMGAGGMIFVDPLYQHILVDVVRTNRSLFPSFPSRTASSVDDTPIWSGLPVIFDEVFVGLHRLGRSTASSFLATKPDIACYAKILTGGLLPLSITLASDAVFQAFWSESKVDALLHGHSYTAHAVGCGVANKTLEILDRMEQRGQYSEARESWAAVPPTSSSLSPPSTSSTSPPTPTPTFSLWSPAFISAASSHPSVAGVMALGTVVAIHLRSSSSGYTSTASNSILHRLRHGAPDHTASEAASSPTGAPFGIHARALGDVIYFMSSLNSRTETLRAVERSVIEALDAEAGGQS